jgi:hypothetical protein
LGADEAGQGVGGQAEGTQELEVGVEIVHLAGGADELADVEAQHDDLIIQPREFVGLVLYQVALLAAVDGSRATAVLALRELRRRSVFPGDLPAG